MHALSPTPFDAIPATLTAEGWAVVSADSLRTAAGTTADHLNELARTWGHLPADNHLRDGGHYRRRRHSCYIAHTDAPDHVDDVPHRAHWQSVTYNALHGGFERWFEPVEPAVSGDPAWRQLIGAIGQTLARVMPVPCWYVEAHQFRVDTTGGIGRPTPEGAHRDGVDFVAVIMVGRHGVKGGETRVFDAEGPQGVRFTLTEPWSLLLLDDHRVIHESTPIQPQAPGELAWRDTLVLTFRAAGFQGPGTP